MNTKSLSQGRWVALVLGSFNIYYQNVRGLRTKTEEFFDSLTMLSHSIDCVVLTETWLNDRIFDAELVPPNFTLFRKDRNLVSTGRKDGGGVAILVKSDYATIRSSDLESFHEQLTVKVKVKQGLSLTVSAVYIPPGSQAQVYEDVLSPLESASNNQNLNVLCLGDFNLPNLGNFYLHGTGKLSASECEVKENLALAGLEQRCYVLNHNQRILDFVLSNIPNVEVVEASEELVARDGHHPPLEIAVPCFERCKSREGSEPPNFVWARGDYEALYHCLSSEDWSDVAKGSDIDVAVDRFYSHLINSFEQCIPKRARKRRNHPPWFTAEVKLALKEKEIARRRFKKYKLACDYEVFSTKRNQAKNLIRRSFRRHMHELESEIGKDPQQFWKHVKQRKGSRSLQPALKHKGRILTENLEKCEAFAEHFKSVYSSICPDVNVDDIIECTGIPIDTDILKLARISKGDVLKAIRKLKPKKSSGMDGVPQYIFKAYADILAQPLCSIFNMCLAQSTFPSIWKTAAVCPVPKKSQVVNVEDHRPICLISAPAKIFEAILYFFIFNHFRPKISNCQYGFVPKRSTTTNLLNQLQLITDSMNRGYQMDVIYTDFQKAFDSVQFPVLLRKLRIIGLSDGLLKLCHSYLYGRKQFVKFNGSASTCYEVNSGVGQGSKLGPLFFLVMINDLCLSVKHSVPSLFADDLKLSLEINTSMDCVLLQEDLDSVVSWSIENELFFNFSKCSVMTFSLNRDIITSSYRMGAQVLNRAINVKDLGVIFDRKLSFEAHITAVVKSSFRMLGFIKRTCRYFRNTSTIMTLYNAFVRSKLEYAAIIWDPLVENRRNQIERVQKKFIRYLHTKITGLDSYSVPYDGLISRYEILSLHDRRQQAKVAYMRKLIHGHEENRYLLELFQFATRGSRSGDTFYIPRPRIEMYKKCPVYSLSIACNNSDFDLFKCSKRYFKF